MRLTANIVHCNLLKRNTNALFIEINCFHSVPVLSELPPVKDNIEELEASFNQSQEQHKEQVKGFISKIRQTIQDKVDIFLAFLLVSINAL